MSEPVSLVRDDELIKCINKLRKECRVSQGDIAKATGYSQSAISRMLNERRGDPSKFRYMRYFEAQEVVSAILSLISPFPDRPLSELYTSSDKVEAKGILYLDEKVKEGAERMLVNGFTQLIVKDRKRDLYMGIVTDYALLKGMLFPKQVSKDWIETFKEQQIEETDLVDKVPTYPLHSTLVEVAEGLMHHYAVLIEEPNGKYGIITRNDFLRLLRP